MKARHVFTLLVATLSAAMLAGAFEYAGTAAFGFPFAVSGLVLVMALALLVADLRADRAAAAAGQAPDAPTPPPEQDRPVDWAGLARIYGFLAGFLVVAHFVSYLVAVPAFLFLFGVLFCNERKVPSAVLAASVGLAVFVIFDQFLPSF
ncbi:hypothetical protein DLJ49_12690 [Rhodovulum sp. 12E13]|uniref:tripartite tricarboxylate transporter TctB family protein n=1 Tax=Rhodovulum sp. 12E13 TaxID=2203891 RepID=UPI000E145B6D|nr:tripartite tricarboxylate transporter TctB family protein [Rhodovulum sp. 12E13]RDC71945.1 hypothetical protein DLJ49_12690 [Rhodovulum sp. 12E13]